VYFDFLALFLDEADIQTETFQDSFRRVYQPLSNFQVREQPYSSLETSLSISMLNNPHRAFPDHLHTGAISQYHPYQEETETVIFSTHPDSLSSFILPQFLSTVKLIKTKSPVTFATGVNQPKLITNTL